MPKHSLTFLLGASIVISLFTASGCTEGRVHDNLPACEDGIDNDGDGLIDFPSDPGCKSPSWYTEADDPPPKPQCRNGIDDDGNGLIDYPADPGCTSPDDPVEGAWNDPPARPVQCADKIDNDGDGLIDYPNDPGCVDATHDDDETDPALEPQCHDGIDNDGDGLTDYPQDPKCKSAAWESEFGAVIGPCGPDDPVENITSTGFATGDFTAAGPNDLVGSCGGNGQEVVYSFTITSGTYDLEASTDYPETTVDNVVYIRKSCLDPASELACNNNPLPGHPGATAIAHTVGPGTYYVVVDTFSPASLGHYKLTVALDLALGSKCDPTSTTMVCSPGAYCNQVSASVPSSWKYNCRTAADGSATVDCCTPPQCSDLLDNDGDGWTDFPDDPGCTAPTGNSELDKCGMPTCAPSAEPQCADKIDNDADGTIDYYTPAQGYVDHTPKTVPADPDCVAASTPNEASLCTSAATGARVNATPILPTSPSVQHTLSASGTSNFQAACGASTSFNPEDVYVFYVREPYQTLTFTTDNGYTHSFDPMFSCGTPAGEDTVLYVEANTCSDTAPVLSCAANISASNGASKLTLASPAVGTALYVFVDFNNSFASGTYGYELDVSGTLADGAPCDPSATAFSCPAGDACKVPAGGTTPICTKAQCSDGVDNDGDGWTDYPWDPGCTTPSTDSELDPCGLATCAPSLEPECANEIDDDGDGNIDFYASFNVDHTPKTAPMDPKCKAASWPSEFAQCGAVTLGGLHPPGTVDMTSAGSGNFAASSTGLCASVSGLTGGAPDKAYGLYVMTPLDTLTLSTDDAITDHDTVLYVRHGGMCSDSTTEIVCNDDLATWDKSSRVTLSAVPANSSYYVFVDSKTSATPDYGNFDLTLSGVVSPGGSCDPTSTSLVCRSGYTCKGTPPTCVLAQCSDGIDNDGDGWIDYPNDPGCQDPSADSELDRCGSASCTPSSEPACSNDVDDDGDGQIDFWSGLNLDHSAKSVPADTDCISASDTSELAQCLPGETVTDITSQYTTGSTTSAMPNNFSPSCNRGSSSPEEILRLALPGSASSLKFTVTGSGSYNPDVYVRYAPCSTSFDLGCATYAPAGSQVSLAAVKAGQYYVFIDSHTALTGSFTLQTQGILNPGQPCDPAKTFLTCGGSTTCKLSGGSYTCL